LFTLWKTRTTSLLTPEWRPGVGDGKGDCGVFGTGVLRKRREPEMDLKKLFQKAKQPRAYLFRSTRLSSRNPLRIEPADDASRFGKTLKYPLKGNQTQKNVR